MPQSEKKINYKSNLKQSYFVFAGITIISAIFYFLYLNKYNKDLDSYSNVLAKKEVSILLIQKNIVLSDALLRLHVASTNPEVMTRCEKVIDSIYDTNNKEFAQLRKEITDSVERRFLNAIDTERANNKINRIKIMARSRANSDNDNKELLVLITEKYQNVLGKYLSTVEKYHRQIDRESTFTLNRMINRINTIKITLPLITIIILISLIIHGLTVNSTITKLCLQNEKLKEDDLEMKNLSKELNASNQMLVKTNEDLTSTNENLDKFTYTVTHDLRSPLRGIISLVELTNDEEMSEDSRSYINLIKMSANKMDNFIVDILTLSKNAKSPVNPVKIDWQKTIKNSSGYVKAHNKDIELITDITDNGEFISDQHSIDIILNNLIGNAIKYHKKAGDDLWVKVSLNSTREECIIIVEDNGSGIKKEHLPKLFDMFYRANSSQPGSGLGLYILKEALQKINGSIKVDSEVDFGTKFTVNLPRLS